MSKDYTASGLVRLRLAAGKTGQLTVPTRLMAFLETGSYFHPEFTDEGILYRFVGTELAETQDVPAWANKNDQP